MKVKVFIESAGNFQERDILKNFYEGIKKNENTKSDVFTERLEVDWGIEESYEHCDVAVIMGSWKDRNRPHHNTRNSVVKSANTFIVIETPFLGRVMFEQSKQHRIGVNGFLNHSGTFTHSKHNSDRLENLGINWNGWSNKPDGHVVIMLQLPGDASLRSIDIYDFGRWAYKKVRQNTDRNIVIRTHPGHNPKGLDEVHRFISDIATTGVTTTQTYGTSVSQTVVGTTINLTATTVNTLFGTNTQLTTSLLITGRDSGARITIPVNITKTNA